MSAPARPVPALLALETSTDVCSVALAREGRVLAALTIDRPRVHAEWLLPLVDDALRYAGAERTDLGAVAVSAGPGSYTGLRIGASVAKGLAAALGLELVAVPTLEALARAARPAAAPADVVLAALPARREEVFAAAWRVGDAGAIEALQPPSAASFDDVRAWMPDAGTVWCVGPAGPALAGALAAREAPVRAFPAALDAAALVPIAHERWTAGHTEDVSAFEPIYLKDFVARRARSVYERLPF